MKRREATVLIIAFALMPSTKKTRTAKKGSSSTKRKAAATRSTKSRGPGAARSKPQKSVESDADSESDDETVTIARRHYEELLMEARLFIHLQHKQLSGQVLTSRELDMQAALRLKCATIEADTRDLATASAMLKAAKVQREEVHAICAGVEPQPLARKILQLVDHDYFAALKDVKDKLLGLFQQRWVVQLMLATAAAGTLGWLANQALLTTAAASTELLREANQMATTIRATTELVRASSKEGARWTFSVLGGAAGAANGLLLSALLPGPPGKSTATSLASAALGMYSGWRSVG
ncbi:MAG: hypothetical protein P4L81_03430 [Candidatus Pacebacteria bacterium]|nr:hypothetical protein [Candidatus Paceibacterota bacterium]